MPLPAFIADPCTVDDVIQTRQHFPSGIAACQISPTTDAPVLAFPSFGLGGREKELGVATWRSTFSQCSTSTTAKLSDLSGNDLGRVRNAPSHLIM